MFIYHLLLKPKFNRENGNARNVFYIVMHGICDWLIFVIWRANFKIGDLICSIRVLAMRIAHANNGFAVYFVNNRMALFAQSQHARTHAAAKLRFHLQNKIQIIVIYKTIKFFGKHFFPSRVCVLSIWNWQNGPKYRHCFSSPICGEGNVNERDK